MATLDTESTAASTMSSTSPRSVGTADSALGFTASLTAKLASTRAQFDAWVESQKARADAAAAAHDDLVAAQQREIDALARELRAIRHNLGAVDGVDEGEVGEDGAAADESIARQRETMRARQAEIEREIADLHLRQRERQRELDDVAKDEAVQRARAEEARKSKQRVEALKEQNLEDLTVGMILYKRLGLTFEKGENGCLRFTFTMLDRNEPHRPFTFTLCVNDDALYEIRECNPPLKAGTIIHLVDDLNAAHDGSKDDFSAFIMGMRKAFKETI